MTLKHPVPASAPAVARQSPWKTLVVPASLVVWALASSPIAAAAPWPAARQAAPSPASGPALLSAEAVVVQRWVVSSGNNQGLPFAVIDKKQAQLWLYDPQGRLQGSTPVLLGLARGDLSVPGIGERAMKDIRPGERTTPAGRFVVEAGHNTNGEDIFWVDYDAAVSMHRVRTSNAAERRLQRLATVRSDDNRVSYGCINVPAAFYDALLRPLFTPQQGVVYVLPETLPAEQYFK